MDAPWSNSVHLCYQPSSLGVDSFKVNLYSFPMKHAKTESASSGELVCQHLRDHPTRQAKPNRNHNRLCVYFSRVSSSGLQRFCALNFEFLLSPQSTVLSPDLFLSQVPVLILFNRFSPRSIARQLCNLGTFEPSDIHPSTGTYPARILARSVAHNGTQKPLQNTLWHTKTRSFFKINFSSAQPLLRIGSRRSRIQNDHFTPVYRRLLQIIGLRNSAETTAETCLRSAETSQQTLRHFSRLRTTYINFA